MNSAGLPLLPSMLGSTISKAKRVLSGSGVETQREGIPTICNGWDLRFSVSLLATHHLSSRSLGEGKKLQGCDCRRKEWRNRVCEKQTFVDAWPSQMSSPTLWLTFVFLLIIWHKEQLWGSCCNGSNSPDWVGRRLETKAVYSHNFLCCKQKKRK